MHFRQFLLTGGALLAALPAAAQTAPDASASPSGVTRPTDATVDAKTDGSPKASGGVRVEEREIVVTGNRFAKFLALTQAKSTISAEERNLAGIGDTRALIDVQPGINYTDTFGLNIRGVGRQTP